CALPIFPSCLWLLKPCKHLFYAPFQRPRWKKGCESGTARAVRILIRCDIEPLFFSCFSYDNNGLSCLTPVGLPNYFVMGDLHRDAGLSSYSDCFLKGRYQIVPLPTNMRKIHTPGLTQDL